MAQYCNWLGKSSHWIKAHHEWQERPERAETLELDAMRHFVGTKKDPMGLGCLGQR